MLHAPPSGVRSHGFDAHFRWPGPVVPNRHKYSQKYCTYGLLPSKFTRALIFENFISGPWHGTRSFDGLGRVCRNRASHYCYYAWGDGQGAGHEPRHMLILMIFAAELAAYIHAYINTCCIYIHTCTYILNQIYIHTWTRCWPHSPNK
jgi:hypothetical protein